MGSALPPLKSEVAQGSLRQRFGAIEPLKLPTIGEINWRRRNSQSSEEWHARLSQAEINDLVAPNEATGGDCYIYELNSLLKTYRANLHIDDRVDNLTVRWNDISSLLLKDIITTGITQPVFSIG